MIEKELDKTRNEMLLEMYKSALKKAQFINQIKSGLGVEIKNGPNKVIVHKKSFYQRTLEIIKKLFTRI